MVMQQRTYPILISGIALPLKQLQGFLLVFGEMLGRCPEFLQHFCEQDLIRNWTIAYIGNIFGCLLIDAAWICVDFCRLFGVHREER